MLSDPVLVELVRESPLQKELLTAAWPSLTVESKLGVISVVAQSQRGSTPDFLLDLAQKDPSEIVRYWATRRKLFNRRSAEDCPARFEHLLPTPEDRARVERLDADPSALVRAAGRGHSDWISGLSGLVDRPQLERIVRLRNLDSPDTDGFAGFVERALNAGVPAREIGECMLEYFAREDVFDEMNELHVDGFGELSKEMGWEKLWGLAASAPTPISYVIAHYAALSGKFWEIDQALLHALPDKFKAVVIGRIWESPVLEFVKTIRANPEKFSKEVVDAAQQHGQIIAEYGIPDESRHKARESRRKTRLESMPNRTAAIFESVQIVQDSLERLLGSPEEATARSNEVLHVRKLLEGIRLVGWLIVGLLVGLIWSHR